MEINFEPVFNRLNEELLNVGQSLTLICAGGYVMQLHGYRATKDVDAFYKSNVLVESIIRKIGDEFGINKEDEVWLNNSVSNMNPQPPSRFCESVINLSNLQVYAVTIPYLIGMKLTSLRGKDLEDVAKILKSNNNQDPFNLISELNDMNFNIDISVILEAYEKAYDMDWLDDFYVNNIETLNQYL